jgi:putative acyl-CoA dehydrogenase
VLRALAREPQTAAALLTELESAAGRNAAFDAWLDPLRAVLSGQTPVVEAQARAWTERLALALQAATLLRAGSPLAPAFCASRLGGQHGLAFGTLPEGLDFDLVLQRVLPA